MPPKKQDNKLTKNITVKQSKYGRGLTDSDNSNDEAESNIEDLSSEESNDEQSDGFIETEKYDELDDVVSDEDHEDSDKNVEETEEIEEIEDRNIEEGGDGECMYRFVKPKKDFGVDDDDFDEEYFIDDDNEKTELVVAKDKRITKPVMTKYERVRLLGERARQLSLGAKPMIKNLSSDMNPKEIARLELSQKVIPIIIIRPLPNGLIEEWNINELEIVN